MVMNFLIFQTYFNFWTTIFVLIFAGFCAYIFIAHKRSSKKLTLYYKSSCLNNYILKNSSNITSVIYSPTFYLFNGHLQTLGAFVKRHKYPGDVNMKYSSEYIRLDDGGQIKLDWIFSFDLKWKEGDTIVGIVPGLTGGRKDPYTREIFDEGIKRNYKSVIINYRGGSGTEVTSPMFYSVVSTRDLQAGIDKIKQSHPRSPFFLFGVSAGALLIANYLEENHQDNFVKGCFLLCLPFDLQISDFTLENTFFGFYHWVLGQNMSRLMKYHMNSLRGLEIKFGQKIEEGLKKVWTSRDFDNYFTCHAFNFTSAFDYYRKASCCNKIGNISVPTFILCADDDPIIPPMSYPIKEILLNENIIFATHPCGGHVGFFTGIYLKQWYTFPMYDYFNGILSFKKE